MDFYFIDFSSDYFSGKPPAVRSGKFVQIRSDNAEYFVVSPKGFSGFHANIVELFCMKMGGIGGRYNAKRDHFLISSHQWSVQGGGFWNLDERNRTLKLSGFSQAYGRFDPRGLRARLGAVEELSGYVVEIV